MARTKSDISVRALEDSDAGPIADFYQAAWDSSVDANGVLAANRAEADENPFSPGRPLPRWGFFLDEELIGYIGSLPCSVFSGNSEFYTHWMKGFMVLPQHRNGPVGHGVLKVATASLDSALVLTVAPSSYRLFGALGFSDLGVLGSYIAPLRPARILDRLDLSSLGLGNVSRVLEWGLAIVRGLKLSAIAGGIVRLARQLWRRVSRPSASGMRARTDPNAVSAEVLNRVWSRCSPELAASPVRNGAYLRWRYATHAAADYEIATIWDGEDPLGYVVVRKPTAVSDPRLAGLRVAVVSDMLFPVSSLGAGSAALAAAEEIAGNNQADALLVAASHPAAKKVLISNGFLSIPGNLRFLLLDREKRGLPGELEKWWLMRGDAESDTTF